eukprot:TRINITY_DN45719_c0_g1_i1.p1 TRINITY_DN45719_c0_g1~~TRINITY_DN45719_c0_g1_i1.p1  ORF type:complete len:132 (-),score=8.83 TRINITY_DN45719_c0_g1_i1:117-485(-)
MRVATALPFLIAVSLGAATSGNTSVPQNESVAVLQHQAPNATSHADECSICEGAVKGLESSGSATLCAAACAAMGLAQPWLAPVCGVICGGIYGGVCEGAVHGECAHKVCQLIHLCDKFLVI